MKGKKDMALIIALLSLGLILLFFSSSGKTGDETTDEGIEERISALCSGVAGVGDCSVMVYYEPGESRTDKEKIESVIVICEGADSVEVRMRLTDMLSSFFGIGSNRVKIEKMKSN